MLIHDRFKFCIFPNLEFGFLSFAFFYVKMVKMVNTVKIVNVVKIAYFICFRVKKTRNGIFRTDYVFKL